MRRTDAVDLDRKIGEQLHQILWRRRITNTAVAAVLDLERTVVGRKLRGERGWTSSDLLRMARFLDVKIELTGEGCAIRDSNPEPADYAPGRYAPVLMLRSSAWKTDAAGSAWEADSACSGGAA